MSAASFLAGHGFISVLVRSTVTNRSLPIGPDISALTSEHLDVERQSISEGVLMSFFGSSRDSKRFSDPSKSWHPQR